MAKNVSTLHSTSQTYIKDVAYAIAKHCEFPHYIVLLKRDYLIKLGLFTGCWVSTLHSTSQTILRDTNGHPYIWKFPHYIVLLKPEQVHWFCRQSYSVSTLLSTSQTRLYKRYNPVRKIVSTLLSTSQT